MESRTDEQAMFDCVEETLLAHAQGWLGDSEALDQIKTTYLELRGPLALEPDDDWADCA